MSYLLAVLSGLLAFMSYPLLGWWPLIFVAWAPLMIAIGGRSWRQRLSHGALAGFVVMLGMEYWIAGTFVYMSGFPWWAAILALVAYCGWHGLQWGVFALLYDPVRRWSGRGWLLTVPLLYVVLERVFPSVFPFFAASALWETPVLLQTAEWIGISGVSWMVVLASCALVHVVEEMARGRASDHFVPTAVAALWLMVSVWGLVRMEQVWSAPLRGAPTVALIQPNVTVEEKHAPDPQVRQEVYRRTVAMTRQALDLRPSMIVWPEGGFPFVFEADAPDKTIAPREPIPRHYSRRLYRLALELGPDLAVGSLRRNRGGMSNSALFFGERATRPAIYDKQSLLLFGERVPLADTFPALRDAIPGTSHYVAGNEHMTWESAGFRFVPSLCYEAIFPSLTREALRQGDGDVLLNFTNDVWFGDTAAAPQHLMLQQARTIENRIWLVRSTNSGISALVDPTGTIRARSGVGEQTTLALEVEVPALAPSFYRRFGDLYLYLAVIAAFFWLTWRNRRELRNFRVRRSVGGRGTAG